MAAGQMLVTETCVVQQIPQSVCPERIPSPARWDGADSARAGAEPTAASSD